MITDAVVGDEKEYGAGGCKVIDEDSGQTGGVAGWQLVTEYGDG